MAFVCRNQSGIQMGIVGILHIVKDISHCYYMLNKMCYSNMGIQFSERKSKSVHTLKCEEASVLDSYPHHSMYKWGIPCYQPHDITPLQMQIALKCIFVKGILVNQRCFRGHSTWSAHHYVNITRYASAEYSRGAKYIFGGTSKDLCLASLTKTIVVKKIEEWGLPQNQNHPLTHTNTCTRAHTHTHTRTWLRSPKRNFLPCESMSWGVENVFKLWSMNRS